MTTQTTTDVKIEDSGPARKRLTITIPAEQVNEKIEESLSTLSSETALPGFRKGRVPRELLERRFGETLRGEAKNQLIADAYAGAIEEHEIKPVGEPEPDENVAELELVQDKPLTFALEVEVAPEFELPSLEGIEIKKPMLEIDEEHLNTEIERQCAQLGDADKIDGDFEPGDRILGHTSMLKGDETEPFFTHDQVMVIYPAPEDEGRGNMLGLVIDDLVGVLDGKGVGDTVNIKTVGPESHEREDIRGVPIEITYTINQAVRVHPAPIEAVVQNYGLENEEMLREQLKLAMEHKLSEEQSGAMRDQAADALLDAVDFELPEKLTSAQIQRTLEQQEAELLYRGMPQEEVDQQLAETRSESEQLAQRRLKLFFLMHALAKHFQVQVSEQEINGRIALIAAQRGMRPEQLRNELAQAGRLSVVAGQIRDHKALDRVIEKAKLTEISAPEWRQFLAAKSGEAAGAAATKKKTAKKTGAKKAPTKKKTSKKSTSKKTSSKS